MQGISLTRREEVKTLSRRYLALNSCSLPIYASPIGRHIFLSDFFPNQIHMQPDTIYHFNYPPCKFALIEYAHRSPLSSSRPCPSLSTSPLGSTCIMPLIVSIPGWFFLHGCSTSLLSPERSLPSQTSFSSVSVALSLFSILAVHLLRHRCLSSLLSITAIQSNQTLSPSCIFSGPLSPFWLHSTCTEHCVHHLRQANSLMCVCVICSHFIYSYVIKG